MSQISHVNFGNSVLVFSFLLRPALGTLKWGRPLRGSPRVTRKACGPRLRWPRRPRSSPGWSEPSWRSTVSEFLAPTPQRMKASASSASSTLCSSAALHAAPTGPSPTPDPCKPAVVNCPPHFSADLLERPNQRRVMSDKWLCDV